MHPGRIAIGNDSPLDETAKLDGTSLAASATIPVVAFLRKTKPLLIAVAFLLFFLSVSGLLLMFPTALRGFVDFRHLYAAGYMLRTGHSHELYDYAQNEKFQRAVVGRAEGAMPFNHPAFETIFYAPFTFLPYQTAYVAVLFVNLMILATCIGMLRPYSHPLETIWPYLPMATVICFLPTVIPLIEGQDSLILLILMIGATIALDRGSDGAAGVLLGMTLFKFQYAIPIALLFFGWRRWRFLAGFAIAGAMVTGLSVSLVGFSGAASYLHSVTAMSAKFSAAEGIRYGIHPEQMANLRGLAFVVSRGSARLTQVLTIALSTIVMIWAAFKRSSLPGALLAALLVSYHQTISDTALLVFPLALILSGYLAAPDAQRERSAALAAILFFGPAFLLLLAGNRLYLLTIPMLGLLAFWDGTYPSPFRDQRAVPAGNESIADRGT